MLVCTVLNESMQFTYEKSIDGVVVVVHVWDVLQWDLWLGVYYFKTVVEKFQMFCKTFKSFFQFVNYTFPISCYYPLIKQFKYYATKKKFLNKYQMQFMHFK